MKKDKKEDIQEIKTFCLYTEKGILKTLYKRFIKYYNANKMHLKNNEYLFIEGDPKYPTLVAHVDTVRFRDLASYDEFFYDSDNEVLWCPELAGFDDRVGVYAIYKLIKETEHRPSILFLNGEEVGGTGAITFIEDYEKKFTTKYFLELDRAGLCDCVFYNTKNDFFKYYIESFGFITEIGTFSDIYYLGPCFKTAAVNISIGYLEEHTVAERLYLEWFYSVIDKVEKILDTADKAPYFKHTV